MRKAALTSGINKLLYSIYVNVIIYETCTLELSDFPFQRVIVYSLIYKQ